MSEYLKHITEELISKLNETEIDKFIPLIFKDLNEENKKKIAASPRIKALLNVLTLLESQNMIGGGNSDLLIKSLEQMQNKTIALSLAMFDMQLNSCSTHLSKAIYQINSVNVVLNFKPFKFQLSLAQKGCDRKNNIICVRTGGGKTLIASIVCKYWRTKFESQHKQLHAAFVVPTKYLAEQQCRMFEKAFDRSELQDVNENDKEAKIAEYFRTKSVVFLTAQKLLNTLKSSMLKLFDIDLLIFDEAHHTNDNHPYNEIMSVYFNEKHDKQGSPLVLGLTASLGTGITNNALTHLLKLSANLDCKDISHLVEETDIEDLNVNIPSPLEDQIVLIKANNEFSSLCDKIIDCITEIAVQSGVSLKTSTDNGKILIGEPVFESFLFDQKDMAIKKQKRATIIGIKYIYELNLVYIRVKDFHINYCIRKLESFLQDTQVEQPTAIEIFSRKNLLELIEYMKANKAQLATNKKLDALVELIKKCHMPDSRGKSHLQQCYNFVKFFFYNN